MCGVSSCLLTSTHLQSPRPPLPSPCPTPFPPPLPRPLEPAYSPNQATPPPAHPSHPHPRHNRPIAGPHTDQYHSRTKQDKTKHKHTRTQGHDTRSIQGNTTGHQQTYTTAIPQPPRRPYPYTTTPPPQSHRADPWDLQRPMPAYGEPARLTPHHHHQPRSPPLLSLTPTPLPHKKGKTQTSEPPNHSSKPPTHKSCTARATPTAPKTPPHHQGRHPDNTPPNPHLTSPPHTYTRRTRHSSTVWLPDSPAARAGAVAPSHWNGGRANLMSRNWQT